MDFEVPVEVHAEDVTLVTNVLTALKALDMCVSYSITVATVDARIVVRGTIRDDVVEVDSDDIHLLLGVSPSRIEKVTVSRAPTLGRMDLVVHIADHTKRVMIAGVSTFVAMKKRRLIC